MKQFKLQKVLGMMPKKRMLMDHESGRKLYFLLYDIMR